LRVGDIRDELALADAAEGCQVIVHLAATRSRAMATLTTHL
jgi:hypothetical protein